MWTSDALGLPWVLWLVAGLGLLSILFNINRIPLIEPDEGRNAEVAREMLEQGDWVVPRYHGLPYLDKPALYFDTVTLSFALFGRSEAAARLPSVVFALGTGFAMWLLGRRIVGGRAAAHALPVLFTAPLFVGFARIVIMDMALTFFVTLALYFAEEGRRGQPGGFALAWAAAALAVLTKGPVGLLLPILGTVALAAGRGMPLRLKAFFHPAHLLLFLALLLPWVIQVESRFPGFLRYAVAVETIERLTQPTLHRTGPVYYYLPVLLLGFFPWSLVILGRIPVWIRSAWRLASPSSSRGLLLAAAAIVLFFSISRSKLGGYVLPALPLLALWVGSMMEKALQQPAVSPWTWVRFPAIALAAVGVFLIAGPLLGLPLGRWAGQPADLAGSVTALSLGLGIVSAAVGLLLFASDLVQRRSVAPVLLGLCVPSMILVGAEPMLRYAEANSSRELACQMRKCGQGPLRAAAVRCLPTSLDYYLGQVVPLVSDTGREITSTYAEREFDRLRRVHSRELWGDEDLSQRLEHAQIDVLITCDARVPAKGVLPAGRVGRYRLWTRPGGAGGPSSL